MEITEGEKYMLDIKLKKTQPTQDVVQQMSCEGLEYIFFITIYIYIITYI